MTCRMTGTCVAHERHEARPITIRPRGVITTDRIAALERLLDLASRRAAAQGTQVVLDLSAVELLGAAAVGAIVRRRKRLTVKAPSPRLRRELKLLRLTDRVKEISR